MSNKHKPNKELPKQRNPFTLHAQQRKAGPLPHKNEPKQGATNEQRELLDEYEEEIDEEVEKEVAEDNGDNKDDERE